MSHYQHYYENQIGLGVYGSGKIGRIYAGSQKGSAIGQYLGGLFRYALPLFKKSAKSVGKEMLKAGVNVLSDVANNVPPKQAMQNRMRESGRNLKRKVEDKINLLMEGSGYKYSLPDQTDQSEYKCQRKRLKKNSTKRKTSGNKIIKTQKAKKKKKKIVPKKQQKQKKKKKNSVKKEYFPDIFH